MLKTHSMVSLRLRFRLRLVGAQFEVFLDAHLGEQPAALGNL